MPESLLHRRPGQDQNLVLQLDALKAASCLKIYQEKVSGSKTERTELSRLLEIIREGDTLIIWKLDRLGCFLNHLEEQHIGLVSLNDPIDTTTAQGRLVFRIFAGLAEFDRTGEPEGGDSWANAGGAGFGPATESAIRSSERTPGNAGFLLGRIAGSLYKENRYSVEQIACELHLSKTTLYKYLRKRGLRLAFTVQNPVVTS